MKGGGRRKQGPDGNTFPLVSRSQTQYDQRRKSCCMLCLGDSSLCHTSLGRSGEDTRIKASCQQGPVLVGNKTKESLSIGPSLGGAISQHLGESKLQEGRGLPTQSAVCTRTGLAPGLAQTTASHENLSRCESMILGTGIQMAVPESPSP